MELAACHTDGT